jgi:hypothetical protein
MSTAAQDPAHLFAAYLELVNDDGTNRRRKQWVMLPQMPARLAPGDSPITNHKSWFEREQRNAAHRAVWRFHQDRSGNFAGDLARTVESRLEDGWSLTLPQVLTCEIHPTELAEILAQQRTPYRVLHRLQKVSRSMYRIDIS